MISSFLLIFTLLYAFLGQELQAAAIALYLMPKKKREMALRHNNLERAAEPYIGKAGKFSFGVWVTICLALGYYCFTHMPTVA